MEIIGAFLSPSILFSEKYIFPTHSFKVPHIVSSRWICQIWNDISSSFHIKYYFRCTLTFLVSEKQQKQIHVSFSVANFRSSQRSIWNIVPTYCTGYMHLGSYPVIDMIRGIMDNEKAMHCTNTSCNMWNRTHILNDSMVPATATAGFTKWHDMESQNDLRYLPWTLQVNGISVIFTLIILNYSISFSG